ncbi:hypothetical protein EI555_016460 [Monodon monoceros]|uniref:RING-type E3 ubiquitin transferase n=1 Tax=Monodon monoceros TaxID=40151 RepID=A0A4U1EHZ3_MONMO|nr:hypothetical protein EI555_016460 [Monodon monoceros]
MRGDRALKQRNLDHRKVFKGHASQRLPTAQSFRSCRQRGCLSLPCVQTRLIGEASCFDSGDVHIQMNSIPKECAENPSSRNIRSGVQSCTQERVHSRYRQGSLMILTRSLEIMVVAPSHNSDISSRGCKLQGVLFILILGVKLVIQHTTGVALGIGLLTTFIHATKSILNQVLLRERCSEVQCAWLLVFIAGSSILSYYTFYSQSLYYSLTFKKPALDPIQASGKYFDCWNYRLHSEIPLHGLKMPILLGYWHMILEELCHYYQTFVPIPVCFCYLISYGEFGNVTRWILGILLALLYLTLKVLDFFAHLKLSDRGQCSDVDDICSICQAEFQKPILICQHEFFEERKLSTVQNCDFRPYKQMERWCHFITPSNILSFELHIKAKKY